MDKNITFSENGDVNEMVKMGMLEVPYLKVDDKLMRFAEAVKWVGEQ